MPALDLTTLKGIGAWKVLEGVTYGLTSTNLDVLRARLLVDHRSLGFVSNVIAASITNENLGALRSGLLVPNIVELANLGIGRAVSAHLAEFQSVFQKQLFSAILPAAFASTTAMAERLQASSETQRAYDDALRRLGWWFPPSGSMSWFWDIGQLAHENRRLDLRREMTEAVRSREFGRIVDGWMDLEAFQRRERFLRDGFQDHRRGRYRVSIPTLIPHIEGIAVDTFGPTTKMGPDLMSEAAAAYDAVMGPAIVEAVGVLWESRSFSDFGPRALNRHFILHGRSTGYATEVNSTKVLFALDLLASIVADAKKGARTPA